MPKLEYVKKISFSHSGKFIVAEGINRQPISTEIHIGYKNKHAIQVWEIESNNEIFLELQKVNSTGFQCSEYNDEVFIGISEKEIMQLDLQARKVISKFTCNFHGDFVRLSTQDEQIATADYTHFTITDYSANKKIFTLEGFNHQAYYASLSEDEDYLITSHHDGGILWDINRKKVLKKFKNSKGIIKYISFKTNQDSIITLTNGGYKIIINSKTGDVIESINLGGYFHLPKLQNVFHVSKNHKYLVDINKDVFKKKRQGGTNYPELRCVNLGTGEVLKKIEFQGQINSLVISENDKNLYAGVDYTIHQWDIETGNLISKVNASSKLNRINFLLLSSNYNQLLSTHHDTIMIWSIPELKLEETHINEFGEINKMKLIDNDSKALIISNKGKFIEYDIVNKIILRTKQYELPKESTIDFIEKSRQAVITGTDGTIRLWSIE